MTAKNRLSDSAQAAQALRMHDWGAMAAIGRRVLAGKGDGTVTKAWARVFLRWERGEILADQAYVLIDHEVDRSTTVPLSSRTPRSRTE